ncbi:MAG TPA: ABC transporter transmembrane domain-containing protein, partial [Agromyces sp.]
MPDATHAVLRSAIPSFRRLLPAVLLGIASAGSSVALLAASAWLIARAAEQPPVLYLSLGIVGVRAFALGRAVFRYLERLTGHDASFRQLAAIRTSVFERMIPIAPDGLASSRRGDILDRFVGDVDELQNVPLRVVQPVVSAVVVLALAVAAVSWLSPGSAVAVLTCLAVGIGGALLVQRWAAMRAEHTLAPLRGELQAATLEHLEALDVLVAFDAAADDRRRIEAIGARLARATRARAAAAGVASAAMTAIGGFAVVASLTSAAPLLESGRIDGPVFAVLCLVPLAIAEAAAAIPLASAALRLAK